MLTSDPSISALTPPLGSAPLSVEALLARAKAALERSLPLCWVAGEISGFKRAASGHCYFDLKDGAAQISCVLYRNRAAMVGVQLQDGAHVEVRVRPIIYEPRGSLQFGVEQARLAGVGRLFEAFLRLKSQLQAEGLFDETLKRPLPRFPMRVGLITSLHAAALADMLRVLRDRWPRAVVVIYPSSVQGINAPAELRAALHAANTRAECDVLVIGRGGGSAEDLWAFNDEALTRAVAASSLPIVSAVGHETDFSLCDFAADARAPTPTAAATMITPEREAILARCGAQGVRATDAMKRRLDRFSERLDRVSARLSGSGALLSPCRERLLRLAARMKGAMAAVVPVRLARLARSHHRLALQVQTPPADSARAQLLSANLARAMTGRLSHERRRLEHAAQALGLLNPQHVLDRGYAVVFDAAGKTVCDASSLPVNAPIRVKLKVGELAAKVVANAEKAEPSGS